MSKQMSVSYAALAAESLLADQRSSLFPVLIGIDDQFRDPADPIITEESAAFRHIDKIICSKEVGRFLADGKDPAAGIRMYKTHCRPVCRLDQKVRRMVLQIQKIFLFLRCIVVGNITRQINDSSDEPPDVFLPFIRKSTIL